VYRPRCATRKMQRQPGKGREGEPAREPWKGGSGEPNGFSQKVKPKILANGGKTRWPGDWQSLPALSVRARKPGTPVSVDDCRDVWRGRRLSYGSSHSSRGGILKNARGLGGIGREGALDRTGHRKKEQRLTRKKISGREKLEALGRGVNGRAQTRAILE